MVNQPALPGYERYFHPDRSGLFARRRPSLDERGNAIAPWYYSNTDGKQRYEFFLVERDVIMTVGIKTGHLSQQYSFAYSQSNYLSFFFLLEGQARSIGPDGQLHIRRPRSCMIMNSGLQPVLTETYQPQTIKHINVICTAASLQRLTGMELAELPVILQRVVLRGDGNHGSLNCGLDGRIVRLLTEIFSSNHPSSALRQLYLRAKLLELLYELLLQLELSENNANHRAPLLHPATVRDLLRVRELTESRLANPPSLKELCRETGLHEHALKNGFKQLFGESVYQYSLNRRFAEAQRLLRGGACSVSEVAERIGYQETASFSRMFRARFGVSPSKI